MGYAQMVYLPPEAETEVCTVPALDLQKKKHDIQNMLIKHWLIFLFFDLFIHCFSHLKVQIHLTNMLK